MKTIRTVEIVPIFVEFVPDTKEMKPNEIYISLEYGSSSHLCLCGCGELTVLPLSGPFAWDFTQEGDKVSFHPSISNYQLSCKSHYIITRNKANFV